VDFTGEGEHDWLRVEKTGANTHWVAEQLARHAGVKLNDVGYAGLKDRHAITRQWFSVRRPGRDRTDWDRFDATGVSILERQVHRRKLRRGAHEGNAFRIAMRAAGLGAHEARIAERIAGIDALGVPNYFGAQRFGHGGQNVETGRAALAGRRMSRHRRSIGLSALRAMLFNALLDARVHDGTWNRILSGELANLDGSASIFAVEKVTPEIAERCRVFDIHPTGFLPGDGGPRPGGGPAALEAAIAAEHSDIIEGLTGARIEAARRPLRLAVRNLRSELEPDCLWLEFELGAGAYATSVLREIGSL
jgi:tRNA pseudouridine13 synthase